MEVERQVSEGLSHLFLMCTEQPSTITAIAMRAADLSNWLALSNHGYTNCNCGRREGGSEE